MKNTYTIAIMCLVLALSSRLAFGGEVNDFARQELARFAPTEASRIELRVSPSLPEYAFAIGRQGKHVLLEGHGEAELLQAAYTALEEMGCRFEVTGPVVPSRLNPAGIPAARQVFSPSIQRRGVRLHINFNMDVSAYPIAEAKEYIRNLARLRYNHVTFHSYACHWTRDSYAHAACFADFRRWMDVAGAKPNDLVTGAYFYGGEFLIPNHPQVRPFVRFNKKYFTAPEFEDVIHTHPDRGQRAQAWLRELMQEAKRCGLTIQFSTELNTIDDAANEELASRILTDYPIIDALEFVSHESDGFTLASDAPANDAMAREIITGTDEAALRSKYDRLGADSRDQVRDYANNIRLIRFLQAQDWETKHKVALVCGSYACRPRPIKLETQLADGFLPQSTMLAFMPGHCSREELSNIQDADIKPEMFNRILINDWFELDGLMMMQQNTAQGVYDLVHYIMDKTGKQSVPGVFCNHWRTAPNAISFRYLDQLSFDPNLDPANFDRQLARSLSIPDSQSGFLVQAMTTLDELSDFRNQAGGNVGFCIGWDLNPAMRDFGSVWWWGRNRLEGCRDQYVHVRGQLENCRAAGASPAGKTKLAYLINGVDCSVEHLDGLLELKDISDKYFDTAPSVRKMRDNLTSDDEAFIAKAANRADGHFQRFLTLLSTHLGDRGEEGMLVNYYWNPVVFCNNIRALYGKQGTFIRRNEEGNVVPQPH